MRTSTFSRLCTALIAVGLSAVLPVLPIQADWTRVTQPDGTQACKDSATGIVFDQLPYRKKSQASQAAVSCATIAPLFSWLGGLAEAQAIAVVPGLVVKSSGPSTPLPSLHAPWSQCDIGSPPAAGVGVNGGGTMTVSGTGDVGSNNNVNVLTAHVVYQPWTGPVDFITQVQSFTGTLDWRQAGIIFTDAQCASTPPWVAGSITVETHTTQQGAGFHLDGIYNGRATSYTATPMPPPQWLRMNWDGTIASFYTGSSATGPWTLADSEARAFTGTNYVGVFTSSASLTDATSLTSANFSEPIITTPSANTGTLTLTAAAQTVVEDAGTFTVCATRGGGTSGAASAKVHDAGTGTATGSDWTALDLDQTLSWANGEGGQKCTTGIHVTNRAGPQGTVAYIASTAASGRGATTPTPTITAGASVPLNALIVVCGSVNLGENSSPPTDTLTNTYFAFGSDAEDAQFNASNCWYAINKSAGTPTVTLHWTGNTDVTYSYIAAYSGNSTSSALVASNIANSMPSSTAQTCNSATATASGQLLTGYIRTTTGATSFAPLSSETERGEEATDHKSQLEDKITSGAGAASTSWTLGVASAAECVTGVFGADGSRTLNLVLNTFSGATAGAQTTQTITINDAVGGGGGGGGASAKKWHPGYYLIMPRNATLKFDQAGRFAIYDGQASNATFAGWHLLTVWANLESGTHGNYTAGDALLRAEIAHLKNLTKPKRLILHIDDEMYNGSFSWYPTYLVNAGCVFQELWSDNVHYLYHFKWWVPTCVGYYNNLITHLGALLDSEPYFEGVTLDYEQALNGTSVNGGNGSGFNHAAFVSGVTSAFQNAAAAFPHTNLAWRANWGDSFHESNLVEVIAAAKTNGIGWGSGDSCSVNPLTSQVVYGTYPIYQDAQNIFAGYGGYDSGHHAGTYTDQRGKMYSHNGVENSELGYNSVCNGQGFAGYAPAGSAARNAGYMSLYDEWNAEWNTHAAVEYNTETGAAVQQWSVGTTGSLWDLVTNHPLLHAACPTDYDSKFGDGTPGSGCNTQ
jgi:hypothetical protein